MVKGRIHSFESMGLVDGPGIRTVIFMQGCLLRCKYCHNPDTWKCESEKLYTPLEVVKKVERYKPYFSSGGGVTFSGGEPLLQPEFLLETLKLLKERGINTCIDTAGYGYGNYDEILKYTDLVLYDVKHYTKEGYKNITSGNILKTQEFLKAMIRNNTKMWIRHVVVPNLTDSREHIYGLKKYIEKIPNVLKVQLLPYHVLGVNKYEKMKIKYPLDGVKPMDKKITDTLLKEFFGEY
ncbi:pyruvate formate-lyase-activating protein [Clostridium sp. BJN0001]|uniref:pyruvate formate-lyase-activating protein n=1 Tax=Clostridium sp. BJN0001 TaxID=2930219 RepID=UPI001FD4DF3C|nr:pyruvate formate-lyase-activating protein [Clostridium sp. BJN0001]